MRLFAILIVLTGIAPGASGFAADPPKRRNVVLLIADDLSLDLGCYGNPRVGTPNIDALARRGTRFTHAFATVASCSASRAVIFTGHYTHTNGQFGHAHHPAELHTHSKIIGIPKMLKNAGYRTGIIAKVHVLPLENYGFDVAGEAKPGGAAVGRDPAAIGAAARRFIEESGDRPFFLAVGFHDPHRAAKGFGNPRKAPDERATDPSDVVVPPYLPDNADVREELAEYYQAVRRLDRGVGEVIKAIRETDRENETLIIFVSDNGMPFPGAKTTLYDSGVRLPMLVVSPEQKRREVVNDAMTSWVDLAPTVLDWTGAKPPYKLPGRSVLPVLEERSPPGWDVVYGSFVFHEITNYYPSRMIRTRTHKLILNLAHPLEFPFASDLWGSKTWQGILNRGDKMLGARSVAAYVHRPRWELYDLDGDPNEVHNLADAEGSKPVLADLQARLKAWQAATDDPWIVKYRYE